MLKIVSLISIVALLGGCAGNPPRWLTGDRCSSIGCGKDLSYYPHTSGEAIRNADRHGFKWGQTSSAYGPNDPKHYELLEKEIQNKETPWHWNNPGK